MIVEGVDSVSEVSPAGLKKRRNGIYNRIRRWYKLPGLAPPTKLGVFNNNLENGYRAMSERFFLCKTETGFHPALPVQPQAFVGDTHLVDFLERVVDAVQLAPVASTREVVNAYTGPKRASYARAEQEMYEAGLRPIDWHLNTFIKFEKCDLGKAPRVINPRSTKYNLVLGKYLKFNEKNYFKAIATVFGQDQVVIKGMDVSVSATQLRVMWDNFVNPCGVGGDASKFDMHVSKPALEFEHLFYLLPYFSGTVTECLLAYREIQVAEAEFPGSEGFEELAWLLSKQLDNSGTAYFDDGVLKFTMQGTRASGDLNTSLGNCILMCAMNWAWSKRVDVPVNLGNNGDDCVTIVDERNLEKWSHGQTAYYANLGFRMVLEAPVKEFEQLEFCQSKPCHVAGTWRMIRNPKTLITKGSMCLLPIDRIASLRKWMMAVGLCEGRLVDGVPVLAAYARAMRRNGLKCSRKLRNLVTRDTSRAVVGTGLDSPVETSTRLSFMASWGITPMEQRALEQHYDNWTIGRKFGATLDGRDAMTKPLEVECVVTELLNPSN